LRVEQLVQGLKQLVFVEMLGGLFRVGLDWREDQQGISRI